MSIPTHTVRVAIIGGGPAGLMAAEALTAHGLTVDLFDAMPSLGRKFLMAGKSGLNLTHAEPFDDFLPRFGVTGPRLRPMLQAFPPGTLQAWAHGLGIETFVGSSRRVFPKDFKAAPLLRAWLRRLRTNGLTVHARHRWSGWSEDGRLMFDTPQGRKDVTADATILALGGASWPKLGSDGAWLPWLEDQGVAMTPLRPANCGFDVDWSDHFSGRFEGQPVKNIRLKFHGQTATGEFVITKTGLEGGPVYALSSKLLHTLKAKGRASLTIDLSPDRTVENVLERLNRPRGKKTMATHLKRTLHLSGVKAGLLREGTSPDAFADLGALAAAIKALPLTLTQPRPIAEAISSSGGVRWDQMDEDLQLNVRPGVFLAGEMLDWDAPTGGYLLSACFATGRWAGEAAATYLSARLSV